MNQYPDDHPVVLLHYAGTSAASLEKVNLHEIDQSDSIGSMTTVFVPALPSPSSFESFQETVAHLRAPNGCPWDREQTHETLRMHLLEECYEALDAIDRMDMEALREELGDLILQIVLQAQIATEGGDFRMAEVIAGINDKLVRRHPHVFGELELEDVGQVLHNWEAMKEAEREAEGNDKGLLDGVPVGLPALAQANELQSRAARVGFDWEQASAVWDKVMEEMLELKEAQDRPSQIEEVGDLFFAVVNYARWIDVDPEASLREANRRFRSRFKSMERIASSRGKKLSALSVDEMNALWEKTKERT
jgi:tetrapyrrole methylase family protein/MazG family protein